MPSSFSRFLDDDELSTVRELYLEALAAVEEDEENDTDGPWPDPGSPPDPPRSPDRTG